MNDKELRQNVIDEVEFEPSIGAADIGVGAEKGVITLGGHVPTYAQKVAAERATEAARIEVPVRDGGSVSLSGTVDNWDGRQAVERAVWSTPGVRAVADHPRIG